MPPFWSSGSVFSNFDRSRQGFSGTADGDVSLPALDNQLPNVKIMSCDKRGINKQAGGRLTMARKKGVNKTKAVLDYFKTHGEAKAAEVVEALAKQGITLTRAHVYTIITQNRKKRETVRKVARTRGIGIPEIKAALGLLKVCDSVSAAEEALAAAAEIKELL